MGLVLKRADQQRIERLPVIRMNYLAAAVLAFLGAVISNQTHISRNTVLLAAVTGLFFVAGILLWSRAIQAAGLALSVVAMRTAIVVPVLASVLFWRERPSALELAGSAVALAALGLVLSEVSQRNQKSETRGRKPEMAEAVARRGPAIPPWLWLALLFIIDGMVMVPAQVFRQNLPQNENWPFQSMIFASAFLVTTLLYYLGKQRVDQRSLGFGAALGACNLGNYLFLVLALTLLPGIVVYPVIAAGEVGLMALAGVVIWRERVGVRSWVGIGLAVLALVLVQVGRAAG